MIFSNSYIFYPSNRELVAAIDHYKILLGEQGTDISPDSSAAVQDNFLYTRGNYEQQHFSTNVLESAQITFETKLRKLSREQFPLQWAALQNSLGNILSALGQQRMDVALYEAAIAAFNLALEETTQESSPSEWATAQYNLGTASQALGRQQDDSKLMKAAVDAYTDALLVWTREKDPEEWAHTMFQLGASFYTHGKLLKGNRTFQKSVVAFKNALAGFDADNHALALAATHNSRGAVLHNLAESEDNAERMEEAIRAYETALTVCMEQQQPFHLAVLCRVNKSNARLVLAELTQDAALAEDVADDFEVIIECFPHALQPLCAKHCENQMNKAREMSQSLA